MLGPTYLPSSTTLDERWNAELEVHMHIMLDEVSLNMPRIHNEKIIYNDTIESGIYLIDNTTKVTITLFFNLRFLFSQSPTSARASSSSSAHVILTS